MMNQPREQYTWMCATTGFLEAFSPGGRERVLARVVYQEVVAGEYLFHEGDPAHGVCLVLEGEIEIVRTARQREEHLATFSAGDYFGEVAILDGHGRSSDARAHGAASVAWLPAADLLEVLLTEPVTLTLQLFQNVLTQLRKTNDLYRRGTRAQGEDDVDRGDGRIR